MWMPKPKFTIRSLLFAVALLAVAFAWLSHRLRQKAETRRNVEQLRNSGFYFDFSSDHWINGNHVIEPSGPRWLCAILGDDFFDCPVSISFSEDGPIENEDLRAIAQLTSLEAVDVSDVSGIDDSFFTCLAEMPNLRVLEISHSQVTGKGFSQLHHLNHLESLELTDSPLEGQYLRYLSGATQLRRLDLSNTPIGDDALSHLEQCTQLEYLDLSHTRITGHGLKHLSRATALYSLEMGGTPLDDVGCATIAKLFPGLTRLNLGFAGSVDSVTNNGLASLVSLKRLEELWIASERLDDVTIENHGSLKLLCVGGAYPYEPRGRIEVGELPSLVDLDVWGFERVHLQDIPNVSELNVLAPDLTVVNFPSLETLTVESCRTMCLRSVPALEAVDLDECYFRQGILREMAHCPELRKLRCNPWCDWKKEPEECSSVSDDDLLFLQQCPHLESLVIYDSVITIDELRYLSKLPELETLDVEVAWDDDDALRAFLDFPSLKELIIHGPTEAGIQRLRQQRPDIFIW